MIDALFHALGTVFAAGAGVLLLAVAAGALVIVWRPSVALGAVVLLHVGSASVLVHIHNVPGVVAGGQVLAVLLSAAMLLLAAHLQPHPVSQQQGANWMLRGLALLFVLGAWWFLDPGYTLPLFSLAETELLIWTALCALVLWSFSNSPLFGGVAVLLWSTPLYALAAVLLPGSGLAAVVGIADLAIALACSYLILLEPAMPAASAQALPPMLPRLRRSAAVRPWGLVRRGAGPTANGAPAGELAPVPASAGPRAALPAPASGGEERMTP